MTAWRVLLGGEAVWSFLREPVPFVNHPSVCAPVLMVLSCHSVLYVPASQKKWKRNREWEKKEGINRLTGRWCGQWLHEILQAEALLTFNLSPWMKASSGLKAMRLLQCSTGYRLIHLAFQYTKHSYAPSYWIQSRVPSSSVSACNTPGKCICGLQVPPSLISPHFPKVQPTWSPPSAYLREGYSSCC